jgi:hypothetical protein
VLQAWVFGNLAFRLLLLFGWFFLLAGSRCRCKKWKAQAKGLEVFTIDRIVFDNDKAKEDVKEKFKEEALNAAHAVMPGASGLV